jgi:hypothetical protein
VVTNFLLIRSAGSNSDVLSIVLAK